MAPKRRGSSGAKTRSATCAAMQEIGMRGIEIAFERLQPIAFALHQLKLTASRAAIGAFELRQRRRLAAIAHVGPDQAVALDRLVGLGVDLVA